MMKSQLHPVINRIFRYNSLLPINEHFLNSSIIFNYLRQRWTNVLFSMRFQLNNPSSNSAGHTTLGIKETYIPTPSDQSTHPLCLFSSLRVAVEAWLVFRVQFFPKSWRKSICSPRVDIMINLLSFCLG